MHINTHQRYVYAGIVGLSWVLLPNFSNQVLAQPALINRTIAPLATRKVIPARIEEGLNLVPIAQAEIAANALTAVELASTAITWNAQAEGRGANSKYVKAVQIDKTTGEIIITFDESNVGLIPTDSTIVFTPYVQAGSHPVQLADAFTQGIIGVLDWGCASVTNEVSSSSGRMLPAITMGTLPTQYAPLDCR